MARSWMRRRQEAERARLESFEASLRQVSQRSRPAPDLERAIEQAAQGFEGAVIRDPLAWRPQIKTRDARRLRLAAARYLFARFPVPEHLEQVWIDSAGLGADEACLRKRWYVVAAGGGSLYKAGASEWLSRKEVHAFLNPPGRLDFEQALWHAIARSFTEDAGLALRIAHSGIARTPRAELKLWREAARFFCVHPTTREEIDDLRDYLADCIRREPGYSLKGRTLASLRRQMRGWHEDLEAVARIDAARQRAEAARARARGQPWAPAVAQGRWQGAAIADWMWEPPAKDRFRRGPKREEAYVVTQLCTAADLVAETRAMRHCVATYAAKCIAGHATIWSLRRRAAGCSERLLTIEIDRQHRMVQARGLANRLPRPEEVKLLERWARARGLALP